MSHPTESESTFSKRKNSIQHSPMRRYSDDSSRDELDEFGRLKRRRQRYRSNRPGQEDGELDSDPSSESAASDDFHHQHHNHSHRRRRRSSLSERKQHRRRSTRYSDDEDDFDSEEDRRRSRHRRTSYERHGRSPSHSQSRSRSRSRIRRRRSSGSKNPYEAAARYIDTEFYDSKVYIGNLESVSRNELERVFSPFGRIMDLRLVDGKDYGFVTFEHSSCALDAIQSMNGKLVGDRHIKVNRAKIPERNRAGFGNVPWVDHDGTLAEEELRYREKSPFAGQNALRANPSPPPTARGRPLTSYDDL